MPGDSLKLPLEFRSQFIAVHLCFAQDPAPLVRQPKFIGVGASLQSKLTPTQSFPGPFLWSDCRSDTADH